MSERAFEKKHKVCMIVQQRDVRGGIAAVVDGYYGSRLEEDFALTYIESYRDGSRFDKLKKALRGYRRFRRLLKENPPELVHIHSSFGPSFYRKLPFISMSHKKGIPVVNHIHGADFTSFYLNASEGKKRRIRKVYEKCSRFIVLSEEWEAHIGRIVPKERITVVENYAIPQPEAEVRDWQPERIKNRQVLFLGEIGERKGAFDLPEIVREVLRETDSKARFVIAGAGETEKVKEMLKGLGIPEDRVSFPGWVRGEEKAKLLRESALLLLPSYNEGMPMSILDAMGYGLPVVSTNVGGIPKLVLNGINGVLCEAGDTKGLAKAVTGYLADEESQRAAGLKSLELVRDHYSLSRHIEKLEEVYREILL